MNVKSVFTLFVMLLCSSCATSTVDEVAAVNCAQVLSIVESPKNTVTKDGFTVLFDGENGSTLKKLLEEALANQIASGCKEAS